MYTAVSGEVKRASPMPSPKSIRILACVTRLTTAGMDLTHTTPPSLVKMWHVKSSKSATVFVFLFSVRV